MHNPNIFQLFISFLKLGLTAFGGPAMVAYIKGLSVNRNKWLDEDTFKNGVALCQSIPGATAMQMAAYVGLKAKGITGALASYIGFGLPAFVLILVLSAAYAVSHDIPKVVSLFNGLKVIVVAIIANATYSFGESTIKDYRDILLAVASAFLFWLGMSPFVVIIGAAFAGIVFFRSSGFIPSSISPWKPDAILLKQAFLLILISLAGLTGLYFADVKLFKLAALMLKIDLFAFGGGFASLPLMFHEIVNVRGWMDNKTFLDGIALGQVTPGPIVITATFVGYLLYGLTGALAATAAIFTPSFLILIVVTPFFDRLRTSPYFLNVTKGILTSFVGLLFFVTVNFASAIQWDSVRVLLGVAALISLLKKVDILYVVLIGAVISISML
ncbi:MAG: chromate efflux transporter [Thermodesulfovibrionales bacterium]|nr:chromate efflux transporter [Thermodesulfovibrionales bacterium]